jgi:sodium transport system permease protein
VALIDVVQFFARLAISGAAPPSPDFSFLVLLICISQVVCIALPALLMTIMFTRSRLKTLLLDRTPKLAACIAAVLLAVTIHPLAQQMINWIQKLYPIQDAVQAQSQAIEQMLATSPYVWLPFVLMAVLPAICEELAFRGFILSGLRHLGHKWWAIALSAVFFGMAHTVVQQSLSAAALGLVIGYVAVQTTSLVPAILFHASYNSLMLAIGLSPQFIGYLRERWPNMMSLLVEGDAEGVTYRMPVVIASAVLSLILLRWLHRLPYQATQEEVLSDARALQSQQLLVAPVSEST